MSGSQYPMCVSGYITASRNGVWCPFIQKKMSRSMLLNASMLFKIGVQQVFFPYLLEGHQIFLP